MTAHQDQVIRYRAFGQVGCTPKTAAEPVSSLLVSFFGTVYWLLCVFIFDKFKETREQISSRLQNWARDFGSSVKIELQLLLIVLVSYRLCECWSVDIFGCVLCLRRIVLCDQSKDNIFEEKWVSHVMWFQGCWLASSDESQWLVNLSSSTPANWLEFSPSGIWRPLGSVVHSVIILSYFCFTD